MKAILFAFLISFFYLASAGAQVLRCPPGSHLRGLNCCQIVAGHVSCSRNPHLSDAWVSSRLHNLLRFNAHSPLAHIDDADLSQPPKSIEEFAALGDAPDVCSTSDCSFDWIRSLAHQTNRVTPGFGQCQLRLRQHYCEKSMWRDLGVEQRFRRILTLGQKHAVKYGVDVRALPCIAARETAVLEPLTISEVNCDNSYSSDEGLGQIIWPTYLPYVATLGFRSAVLPADPAALAPLTPLRERFDHLGNSVEKQLEIMAFTLAEKRGNGSYLNAFINYNGSAHKVSYGAYVNACFTCLQNRVNVNSLEVRGDPLKCLSAASGGGRDILEDYAVVRRFCKAPEKIEAASQTESGAPTHAAPEAAIKKE